MIILNYGGAKILLPMYCFYFFDNVQLIRLLMIKRKTNECTKTVLYDSGLRSDCYYVIEKIEIAVHH
jgi:hypothetical protein